MAGLTVNAGFPDLRELQADLESVEIGLGHLITDVAREAVTPVVAEIQALLPFDPEHRGWRGEHKRADPGHIRDSVRGQLAGAGLIVRSTHPGGPVHWWGGTIAPRGAELTIERRPGAGHDFESKAVEQLGRDLDSALDRLCREHGL